MTQKLKISNLDCLCASGSTDKIAYILYPMDILAQWIEPAAEKYGVTIVVVTGMDWQNVFSPWPAAGVPKGTPDFKGEAPNFLRLLQTEVITEVESKLGMSPAVKRTLVGVSMSGLFTLWQWMLCDTFDNIASLSGSFWYEGFLEWFGGRPIPPKTGRAFFLLGHKEPYSSVRTFNSVGTNTIEIVSMLKAAGIGTTFEWVTGDHFSDPVPRLNAAFTSLYLQGPEIL